MIDPVSHQGRPNRKGATMRINIRSYSEADTVASLINDAHAEGKAVTFNGEQVKSHGTIAPATTWQNGSLSVTVVGRTARTGTRWAKVGTTVAVEVK